MAKTLTEGFITGIVDGISIDSSIKCNSSNYNNLTSRNGTHIVNHYTGNAKDTAKANAQYFQGANRKASAHFFVDDTSIYQSVELRDAAWHCGATTYYHATCRNANSIGIEMCCTAGNYKISETTKRHAAYLNAYLCKMLGITADQVDTYILRHYDVTHKSCPAQMAGEGNAEWKEFKEMIKQILRSGQITSASSSSAVTETAVAEYSAKVTADSLNVRQGPGTSYTVVGSVKKGSTVTIVAESNGWGKLKSGAGWVSLQYVQKITNATSSTTATTTYTVKITADVLNIRSGPSVNDSKVGSVNKGEVYTIVAESNGWGKLKSGAGWISLAYTTRT